MQDAIVIPNDLKSCEALIVGQHATISSQALVITKQASDMEDLNVEMEKLRKLISRLIHGNRSEKRIIENPNQAWLPFESQAELDAARAEAEAEAEVIVQEYILKRQIQKKKPRNESLPAHLRREEKIAEVPDAMKSCPEHGERTIIGYDETESLVYTRPELYVLVTKYPKFACPENRDCGVASPERPTTLIEGDRYSTSVAATIIEAKWFHYMPIYRQQDIFAGSGWQPGRSTLLNIVTQAAFVLAPLVAFMTKLVKLDIGVGLDETSCRILLPKEVPFAIPGDAKSRRWADKVSEARSKKQDSLMAKMWAYMGLHKALYNIFDFRVSRHRDGPDEFFRESQCKVQGDCFSGNTSVVVQSDGRLEFVACWGHAHRKVVEASTFKTLADTLLDMIQTLYDIETRAKDMTWEDRQALRLRESTIILDAMKKWLDSLPEGLVNPKSDFAEALRYIRNHWEALCVYSRDGRIPIDNNQVEQLMKQVALGRKAWLFVCNVASGEQSAMMMTLVSSAKRHDLHIGAYIQDVLNQLLAGSTDYQSLLPDIWKQNHPEAVRTYRAEERRDKAERKQYDRARRRLLAAAKSA